MGCPGGNREKPYTVEAQAKSPAFLHKTQDFCELCIPGGPVGWFRMKKLLCNTLYPLWLGIQDTISIKSFIFIPFAPVKEYFWKEPEQNCRSMASSLKSQRNDRSQSASSISKKLKEHKNTQSPVLLFVYKVSETGELQREQATTAIPNPVKWPLVWHIAHITGVTKPSQKSISEGSPTCPSFLWIDGRQRLGKPQTRSNCYLQ